jgi:hypothetical protein
MPYIISCIPVGSPPVRKCPVWGRAFVYNTDLVRKLCGEIAQEKDPEKAQDLMSLLQAVVKDDQEDIRIRMAFLAKKYGLVSDSKAAD